MNKAQFTAQCRKIQQALKTVLNARILAQLKFPSAMARREHRTRMNSLTFPVLGASPKGFWHPEYGNYTFVHDPGTEMVENAVFQVRFIFFLRRRETGSGRFSHGVNVMLQDLDNINGFAFKRNLPVLVVLKKTYDAFIIGNVVDDLRWLIEQTYPTILTLAGAHSTSLPRRISAPLGRSSTK